MCDHLHIPAETTSPLSIISAIFFSGLHAKLRGAAPETKHIRLDPCTALSKMCPPWKFAEQSTNRTDHTLKMQSEFNAILCTEDLI